MRLPRPQSRENGLARVAVACALVALLAAAPAFGQGSSGRITGSVTAADTGSALAWANVSVLGTPYGATSNQAGEFVIDLVPVGTYTVQVSFMGYTTDKKADVVVDADRSTQISFSLQSDVITLQEIVVEETRPMIETESTATRRSMDKEEVKVRPINTVQEAIATQPGVVLHEGEIHVRGGRSSEVKMYVDGVAITNAGTGRGNLEVSLSSLSEFELLSGGFDAEYGNVQSGVINLQTREGGRDFSGEVRYMTDDFGAPEKTYDNFDNLSFGMGGPLFTERVRFYVSGEGRWSDTYLKTTEIRPEEEVGLGLFNITARQRQSELNSGQGKLSWHINPRQKLTGEFLMSRTRRDHYDQRYSREGYWSRDDEDWFHVPLDTTYAAYNAAEHTPATTTDFSQRKISWRDQLSPTTFYTFRLAKFESDNQYWLYEDPNEYWWQAYVAGARVTDPDSDGNLLPEPGYYRVAGDLLGWNQQITKATTIKADLTNQANDTHQVKTGFEIVYNELAVTELSLGSLIPSVADTLQDDYQFFSWERALNDPVERSQHNIYDGFPANGAIYVQDRMRYEGMIVRAGLRLDWSDPGPASGVGEYEIWRERMKAVISPRLGIAHPISDRDALHFHYGRFYQMPHLTAYYTAGEDLEGAAAGRIIGYSGLEPEVTTSYQFGAEHQFSQNLAMDVTGFYKDIFGLLATERFVRGPTDGAVFPYVNKDYASVRGVEFKLTKRFSNYFSGNFTYTWLNASGVSSDENQGQQAEALGLPRQPLSEIPLDWDERHSVTGFLFLSDPGNWEVTFDYNYGSGTPYTPTYLGQKQILPELINSGRLPSHQILNMRGTKKYKLYNQEFRLFFEALNVFDKQNVIGLGAYGPEYYTEAADPGGAYVEVDPEGAEYLKPLNDPSVYQEGLVIRIGVAIDW